MNVIEIITSFRRRPRPGHGERRSRGTIPAFIVAAALAAALAGCADMGGLAPELSARPAASLEASTTLAGAKVAQAAWPAETWWKAYGDPQLDALIDEALRQGPTLAIAEARTRAAVAAASVAGAGRLPRVDADASTAPQRFSEHGLVPPPYAGTWQTFNQLELTLNWEIDFWGKQQSAYQSALGSARAAEVDAAAARLALTTGIAAAYAELRHTHMQRDVTLRALDDRERILALTHDRVAAGLDSQVELRQAEAAVPATREELIAADERIALLQNQIAALLGAGPDRGRTIARPSARFAAVALPSVLPAELIGRRPDVVAQIWRVEAARKDIDAAKAAFYPNVNLAAFVGLSSIGASQLLRGSSVVAGVTPAVTLPIFDAGRLRGNLAGKDAEYDIAVASYNALVVDAVRDVVDQVTSLASVARARGQQRLALEASQKAYELALVRYREGLGNYLQVLSAEQPMLTQQSAAAELDARELALGISLTRALGGGFLPPDTLALEQGTKP